MYDLIECRIVGHSLQTVFIREGSLVDLAREAKETNSKLIPWQGWCLCVESQDTPHRVVYPLEAR